MQLYHGDCLEILPTLEAGSVDCIITDPPYGLAFMGKNWDRGVPGEAFWREALRVAKPGAILLAFGGTRTHHRLMCAIEDAGWEIRDCMMWLYGSGFPKSKAIDKAIDEAKGAKREVVALSKYADKGRVKAEGWGMGDSTNDVITAPATPLARQWDGWGTALKPAWEPIIVAQKPVEGTYAANAEKWGVAGLWIDGGRVGTSGATSRSEQAPYPKNPDGTEDRSQSWARTGHNVLEVDKGRWPANLILDEEAGAILDEQSEGASRFFYCAKAPRSERGEGNNHPTVKPLALMQYLCRLTKTPAGGVVLDPFMGSGSTGIAALLEGRDFIGIEKDEHYFNVAKKRIEQEQTKPRTMRMELAPP